MTANQDEYRIERFTLDKSNRSEAIEVMRAAYLTNDPDEGGTISFTEDSFHILCESPAIPKDLFVRAIHVPTGKMVGFLGSTPRTLHFKGKKYKAAFPGFLAVDPAHRRNGLAMKMGVELFQLGRKYDYEAWFALYEPEAHGINTAQAFEREQGLPYIVVLPLEKYLIRVFNVTKAKRIIKLKWYEALGLNLLKHVRFSPSGKVRLMKKKDIGPIIDLMDDHRERNEFALTRDEDDLRWFLTQPGIVCVVHTADDGRVDGFIAAWQFNIAGFGNKEPFGWIDLIHAYKLNKKEGRALCEGLCYYAREKGWLGLQTPLIPYINQISFKAARFVDFPKGLILVLHPLVDLPDFKEASSYYFDWR